MNVLFIAHGFPPAQHSGVFRTQAFARYLPEYGIEPVIVAATDAPRVLPYPSSTDPAAGSPSCPVYRVDWGVEGPTRKSAGLMRLLLRIPLGATLARRRHREEIAERVLPVARQAIKDHPVDLIYASSPPEEALLIAARLNAETRIPFVCDLRDPWSYGFDKRYRHVADFWLERRLERDCLSKARLVIANTPKAREMLVTLVGVEKEKVACVPNGFDEEDFTGIDAGPDLEPGKFTILYTGILVGPIPARKPVRAALKRALGIDFKPMRVDSSTRSPRWLLKAVENLLDQQPELRDILRVLFVGNYSQAEMAPLHAFRHPECVRTLPAVSRREALALCCRASLLLLLQVEMKRKGRDTCTAVPAKLFDYLRSGTRILAPLQPGDAADLVREFDAGIVVPPRDTEQIAAALRSELASWRNGGSRRRPPPPGLQEYSRRELTRRLAEILQRAVAKS